MHKLGRLYFRFIHKTPLEKQGWSASTLAEKLQAAGFIQILEIQGYDAKGRWTEKVTRFKELKKITFNEVLRVIK